MEIFIKTFESVFVLLGLGFFGFYLISKRFLKQDVLKMLSPIALFFAVPSMIFYDLIKNFEPDKILDWWSYPIYWFFSFIFGIILSYIFSIFVRKDFRKEFLLSMIYPNAIFIPVVLIANLFGENDIMLVKLYLFTLPFPVMLFNFYQIFVNKDNLKLNLKIFLQPIILITIFSVIIKYLRFENYIPNFLLDISRRIGSLSIPIILLIIGGNIFIQFEKKEKIHLKETIYFVFVKNLIFPFIHLLLLKYINIPYDIKFLIFIQSAVPPVTAIPLLIEREKLNVSISNQFLLFSFIFALLSLPFMYLIFTLFL